MPEKSLDKLYKLIEYVLVNDDVLAEEILRGVADTNTISIALNSWCLSNAQEKVYSDICTKSFSVIDEAITSVFNYIILKQLDGKVKLGNDILSRFLSMVSSFAEVFRRIVRDSIVIQEEKVLCKIKKPVAIYTDKVMEKGYITLVPLDLAVILTVLGYVEPLQVQVPLT
jgi:hypothetical protein